MDNDKIIIGAKLHNWLLKAVFQYRLLWFVANCQFLTMKAQKVF